MVDEPHRRADRRGRHALPRRLRRRRPRRLRPGRAPHRPPADDGGPRHHRRTPVGRHGRVHHGPVQLGGPRPRVLDAPRDRPASGRCAARRRGPRAPRARERPRLGRGLAQDACPRAHHRERAAFGDTARHRPPPRAGGRPLPRVARPQQLHLPRLPRVLPHARGRPGRLAPGPRHRARPAALRPAFCRKGTRAHPGCQPGRSRLHHPHHHQGQLARDGPPRRLPRLHLDQALRRPR